MSNIPPIEDSYIDNVIKSSGPLKPGLNKTQGLEMRALIKLLRNRLESEIAENYSANQAAISLKADTDQVILKSTQINGKPLSGNVTLDKNDIGLANVDNTADADKPVSNLTQAALGLKADVASLSEGLYTKVDKVLDKQLSTEDFSTVEKNKLTGIQDGATANESNSYLLARANHTGTQGIDTITGLSTALDAKISLSEKGQNNGIATLDGGGKIPLAQISEALLGSVSYQGNYDAATNSPTLPAAFASKGKYYVISVAGTQEGLAFQNGDWIISNGTVWQKVDNSSQVTAVNGMTGAVNITDITGNAGSSTVSKSLSAYQPYLDDTIVLDYNQGGECYRIMGLNDPNNGVLTVTGAIETKNFVASSGKISNAPIVENDIVRLQDISSGKTIGANTTGNAGSATSWGGRLADLTTLGADSPTFLYGSDEGLTGKAWDAVQVSNWLGTPNEVKTKKGIVESLLIEDSKASFLIKMSPNGNGPNATSNLVIQAKYSADPAYSTVLSISKGLISAPRIAITGIPSAYNDAVRRQDLNFDSGIYSPNVWLGNNMTGIVLGKAHYMKIKNEVTVTIGYSGGNSASGDNVFYVDLPTGPVFASSDDLVGFWTAGGSSTSATTNIITAVVGESRAICSGNTNGMLDSEGVITFTYSVIYL